jgi:hypothetical protein
MMTLRTKMSISSLLVYLDKEYSNDIKKEIWSWSNNQQQLNNPHTVQRWKICYYTNNSAPYRTQGIRPLLANYFEHGSHNLSRMWEHDNTTTTFDTFQGRRSMSISCKYCCNPIVFDDNRLSKYGKRIPLQEWDHKPHECKFRPYIKARTTLREKIGIDKISEYQVIENLRDKVAATNNRLEYYEVKLIVNFKE